MSRTDMYRTVWLIGLQRVSWWLFLICAGVLTVLYVLFPDIAPQFDLWLVGLIGTAVLARLVMIAELFRVARLYRYYALGYLVVLLLLSTVLIKRIWP